MADGVRFARQETEGPEAEGPADPLWPLISAIVDIMVREERARQEAERGEKAA